MLDEGEGARDESLHDRLVEAVAEADKALGQLGFELVNCVLGCAAACFRDFGEDAARAAHVWTDPEGYPWADPIAPVASREPLRPDEVQAFFADLMTRHYCGGRPCAEVPIAVAEVFRPLATLLARVPPSARWYSIDAPGWSGYDIHYVNVAVAFDGAVTCIHLGYSD